MPAQILNYTVCRWIPSQHHQKLKLHITLSHHFGPPMPLPKNFTANLSLWHQYLALVDNQAWSRSNPPLTTVMYIHNMETSKKQQY